MPELPATNGVAVQPVQPRKVNLNREFVAATRASIGYLAGRARTLPQYVDDLTRDFGIDLYDRMMKDPQVSASVETLVFGVLAQGWYLAPTIDDEDDPEHAPATAVKDFWQRSLDALPGIVERITAEVLIGGISGGHKLAEVTTDFGRGDDSDRYVLKSIKTKDRGTYAFVVDRFMNLVGIRALTPDKGPYDDAPVPMPSANSAEQTSIASAAADAGAVHYNILPPEKFAIFTWHPKGNDPRGQAALNTAYDCWWAKKQGEQEEMKFIAQAAVPSLVGFTPEGAGTTETTDALGNVTGDATTLISPEQKMADRLADIKNGSVAAFPAGADVKQFVPAGDGSIFANFFAYKDKQISLAITKQILATNEAQFQARASSQTHKSILDVVVNYISNLATTFWRNIFRNVTRLNYGEEAARKFTPWLLFGAASTEGQLAGNAPAVVALHSSGYLAPNQYVWADEQLGAPPREGPPPTPPPQAQGPGQGGKLNPAGGTGGGAFSLNDADGCDHWGEFVAEEYHGPRPPGKGWVQAGKGPRGGLIWRRGAAGNTGGGTSDQSSSSVTGGNADSAAGFHPPKVSGVTLNAKAGYDANQAKATFGVEPTVDHVSAMIGIPGDAHIQLSTEGNKTVVAATGQGYQMIRKFYRDGAGKLVCENKEIEVTDTGKGLGTTLFVRQAKNLSAAGVDRIETMAAGGPDSGTKYVGFKVWPKFGYDGPISDQQQRQILMGTRDRKFLKAKTVSQLYAMPGGREAWEKFGSGIPLTFDLKAGSHSMNTLDAYLESKKNAGRT